MNKTYRQRGILALDLFMVVVAAINLVWIVFDWVYASAFIQELFEKFVPAFPEFYNPIHADFIRYDLFFVAFFLAEFFIRWAVAVVRKEHDRWYFYPMVNWYDLLGCIPIGGFRWLRFLRMIVVAVRLQRLGIIQYKDWYVSQLVLKYYEIFVEELSDRVVANVIKEIQFEVRQGLPVGDKIKDKVIDPHKSQLIEIVAERLQRVVQKNYELHEADIRQYVNTLVKNSTQANSELKLVNKLPILGNVAMTTLQSTISDMVNAVIEKAVSDFITVENFSVVEEILEDAFQGISEEGRKELERIVSEVIVESLEIMKGQVEVKRWKEKYSADSGT